MRVTACLAALLAAAFAATAAFAQSVGPVDPGAQVDVSKPESVTVNGVTGVRVRETPGASQGYMVPDATGGYVYYQPGPPARPRASRDDAEEVRLYARELAAQITGGIAGDAPLVGVVSIPSAFVDQDTRLATSFGRLMGEQMIYELNSRGFPVQEARGVVPRGRRAPAQAQAVLAGTYYVDRDDLYVNARLVEPSGRVIRTGSVLIPMTNTLRRMLGIPVPDPSGLRPTLPTLIGARDVNDPPGGAGYREARPYSPLPLPLKKAPVRRTARAAVKKPCPPGCEPVDAPPRAAAPKASSRKAPAAAPQPETKAQPAPAQPDAQPQPAPPPPAN